MKNLSYLFCSTALVAALGCATSAPADPADDGGGGTGDGGTVHQGGEGGDGGGFQPSGGGGPGPADVDWPTSLSCPEKAQDILIFDFRSGWWDDLEQYGEEASLVNAVADTCDNITVEYHHVYGAQDLVRCLSTPTEHTCTYPFDGGGGGTSLTDLLIKASLEQYTQLWVLSGYDGDGGVTESSQMFQEFLADTKGSCLPVFIGGGAGNHVHANVVAEELGLGQAFLGDNHGDSSIFASPVQVMSLVGKDEEHVIFQDVVAVADRVASSQFGTDWAIEGQPLALNPVYDIVGMDANDAPSLAVGAIALPDDGARPFVLDGGIQRYYAVFDHAPTRTFLGNVVKLLGSVGCKADIPE